LAEYEAKLAIRKAEVDALRTEIVGPAQDDVDDLLAQISDAEEEIRETRARTWRGLRMKAELSIVGRDPVDGAELLDEGIADSIVRDILAAPACDGEAAHA
jgi:hypothetical protein